VKGAGVPRRSTPVSADERILALFRARHGGVVSGEEMSADLGISRTAIWKRITSLRQLGFVISAIPSRGYRLESVPDLLLPAELSEGLPLRKLGTNILTFRQTTSTNDIAYRLAEEGAVEGTVVIADQQSRGKGRLGREWVSPPGVNLYCSLVLRPPILPTRATQLTFLSAVGVARAIARLTPLEPRIKWPNDVLVGGRKVAGLLNEMSAETDAVHFVILGIGVNLNMATDQLPPGLRHPATSLLLESEARVDRIAFTRQLLLELDELYMTFLAGGSESIRAEWIRWSRLAGFRVRVSSAGSEVSGTVRGIDDDGALLVEVPGSRMERILAGDVTILAEGP